MSGENGSQFDYKFGTKNNWRRCVWNRITERLFVEPRDAIVLYLAGEMDLDRKIAKEHGFRDENMIAVERDKDVCDQLRSRGVLTIHAELKDALFNWSGPRIDVLFGDYCGNLNHEVIRLAATIPKLNKTIKTVLAFNFLRGRELLTDEWERANVIGKHRGNAFASICAAWMRFFVKHGIDENNPNTNEVQIRNLETNYDFFLKRHPIRLYQLSYMSSSGQRFDSAIWRNWSWNGFILDAGRDMIDMGLAGYMGYTDDQIDGFKKWEENINLKAEEPKSKLARQITAVRAVRTHKIAVRQSGNN